VLQVLVPRAGPAAIAGIPIADTLLEQLRANASIEPVLVDGDGVPVAVGKRFRVLSPKIARAVPLRDGICRCGCDLPHGRRSITSAPNPGVVPTILRTW
jgi:hypothetical protein